MRVFGFKPSEIDDNTVIYSSPSLKLPEKYSYKKYLPKVFNQGQLPYCVPYSISTYLNWRENLKNGNKIDNKINYEHLFKGGEGSKNGMTFINAFNFLKNDGVKSKNGILKISSYGLIKSIPMLKSAIVANGPCFGGLPVYNDSGYVSEFWKKENGLLSGYHAVSIIGYDDNGFIIRNSWGSSYGKEGYSYIKNEDMKLFKELWTIMS